jgi:hypothetical protein
MELKTRGCASPHEIATLCLHARGTVIVTASPVALSTIADFLKQGHAARPEGNACCLRYAGGTETDASTRRYCRRRWFEPRYGNRVAPIASLHGTVRS